MLDPTIGSFQLGWKVVDDWFDVAWDKGAVRVEKTGPRTAVLRFDLLSKEGVSFNAGDVDYRYTLGIRVDGVTPDAIERIEVYTASKPTRTRIRVMLDAGKPVNVKEVELSGHNCEIVNLEAGRGTKPLEGIAWVCSKERPPSGIFSWTSGIWFPLIGLLMTRGWSPLAWQTRPSPSRWIRCWLKVRSGMRMEAFS